MGVISRGEGLKLHLIGHLKVNPWKPMSQITTLFHFLLIVNCELNTTLPFKIQEDWEEFWGSFLDRFINFLLLSVACLNAPAKCYMNRLVAEIQKRCYRLEETNLCST